MPPRRWRSRGSRLRFGLNAVLIAYALAAALLPLGHHDVACHLKSSTHCTSCVVGSSADLTADATAVVRQPLPDAGSAATPAAAAADSVVPDVSSGRSPPAAA